MTEIPQRRIRWINIFYSITVILFSMLLLVRFLSYDRAMALQRGFGGALILLSFSMQFVVHCQRLRSYHWLAFVFAAWYAVSRFCLGDHYLQHDSAQQMMAGLLGIYALAFPAATLLQDAKERLLRTALWIIVTLLALIEGVGLISAIQGCVITIPFFGNEFGIMLDGRLWVLGTDPFFTSVWAVCGALLLLYLLSVSHTRWLLIPVVLFELVFLMAVRLSGSRSGIIIYCLGMGLSAYIMANFLLPVVRHKRWLRAACAVLTVAVLCIGMICASSLVSDLRPLKARNSFFRDLRTLTDRTIIWRTIFPIFSRHPGRLLTGFEESKMMSGVNRLVEYGKYSHMHNAFLQTLMLGGIPALGIALILLKHLAFACIRILRSCVYPAKLLVIFLFAILLQMQLEPYLFLDDSFTNYLFWLIAGYVMYAAQNLSHVCITQQQNI